MTWDQEKQALQWWEANGSTDPLASFLEGIKYADSESGRSESKENQPSRHPQVVRESYAGDTATGFVWNDITVVRMASNDGKDKKAKYSAMRVYSADVVDITFGANGTVIQLDWTHKGVTKRLRPY